MLLALPRAGRADLSAAGAEGRTPLQVAVEGGHEEAAGVVRRMLAEGSLEAVSSAVEGEQEAAARAVMRRMVKGGGSLEAASSAVEGLHLYCADEEVPAAVAAGDLLVLPNELGGLHTSAPLPALCGEERLRCDGGVEDAGSAAVTVLIDASADHPGAGSFLIDGALTPSELARLRALYTTLEGEAEAVEQLRVSRSLGGEAEEAAQRRSQATGEGLQQEAEGTGEISAMGSETRAAPASTTQQRNPRSDAEAAGESARYGGVERRYFCDAEGWVRAILTRALERAGPLLAESHPAAEGPSAAVPSTGAASSGALPFMRFLHYRDEGASMAPHVDLSKKAPGDQVWGCRPSGGRGGGAAWNPPMLTVKPIQRAGLTICTSSSSA